MTSPLRSLFSKIFLWFWLSLALLLGAMLVVGRVLWREPQPTRYEGNPFGLVAGIASDVLATGGPPALEQMLNGLEERGGLRTFLMRGGREIRGRPFPPGAAQVAETARSHGGSAVQQADGRLLFAYVLDTPRANVLVMVLEPRPLPAPLALLAPAAFLTPWSYVLLIGVAGLLCLGLVRWLLAPLRRIREATHGLAAGDLGARTGYGRRPAHDELEAVASDFDHMAERIETLIRAHRQLLSDISHELRSPLARMSVAIGMVRARAGDEDPRMIDRIERESERLNELIGELLQLSRLENHDLSVRPEHVDLSEVVEELVEDARFEAQEGGRQVSLETPGRVFLVGHRDLLRRSIENVVRNALRYTPSGGRVDVRIQSDGREHARVIVRDRGPGVPADQLVAIFEPFHRVEQSRDRASGGAGLGLAIARRAIEAHGGRITARPASGGGLEVEMRLPVAGPESPQAERR